MKNRMIAWVSGVVLVVVTLMVIIVKLEPLRDGIIRAQAMKAMAPGPYGQGKSVKRGAKGGEPPIFPQKKRTTGLSNTWIISTMRAIWTRSLRHASWPQPRDILHTRRLHTWPARCPAS